jgi:AraC family transcriptional regulator, transcriptional activator of pobA
MKLYEISTKQLNYMRGGANDMGSVSSKSFHVPIVNPELFAKYYFNYELIKEKNFDVNIITPKEQESFLLISNMEESHMYLKLPTNNIKTTFFEIALVTNGYSVVTSNLNEVHQSAGQIRFSSPGKISSIQKISQDIRGFHCLFDQSFMDMYSGISNSLYGFPFFDSDALPLINLNNEQISFFSTLFSKLKDDAAKNEPKLRLAICHYILSILKECSIFFETQNQPQSRLTSSAKIAQSFLQLVNKYYLAKRTLVEYAELLNITTKHLTKSVKASTGDTPMNFIYRMIILEAKVLLKETNLTAAEIAYQLSFQDAAYFNRFFKQSTGLSPIAFRKKVADDV